MNAQENALIVQEAFRLFGLGDFNRLFRLYADDIEFVFPGPPDLVPLSGTFRGKEQVGQLFARLNEHIQFEVFEPREFLAHGDKVVTLGYNKGAIRNTGKSFDEAWVHVYTIRNGKVSRCQVFLDTYKMVAYFSPATAQQASTQEV